MKLAASPVAILKKRVSGVHECHRQYKELQNAHIHTHTSTEMAPVGGLIRSSGSFKVTDIGNN